MREVQAEFHRINARLAARRDRMDDQVVENMMAGYARVDALIGDGVDVFAPGNVKHLLELNALVLCGAGAAARAASVQHMAATERRFYEERAGGIEDVVEWHARHAADPAWLRAAGVYVRILSQPQLFIEGNHRTGALVMSYILLRDGHPPFVLSTGNAVAYFDPSSVIRNAHKQSATMLLRMPRLRRRLAALLRDHADRRHLATPRDGGG